MNRTVAQLAAVVGASVALITGCAGPTTPPVVPAPVVPLVQVNLETSDPALVDALVSAGHRGIPIDRCECFYVPAYTTVDIPGGIWTITPDTGPRLCEDGMSGECTGTEFLPR